MPSNLYVTSGQRHEGRAALFLCLSDSQRKELGWPEGGKLKEFLGPKEKRLREIYDHISSWIWGFLVKNSSRICVNQIRMAFWGRECNSPPPPPCKSLPHCEGKGGRDSASHSFGKNEESSTPRPGFALCKHILL